MSDIPALSEAQKSDLRSSIAKAIAKNLEGKDSWYELVKIGPILLENGINCKEIGFSSLSKMLNCIFPEYKTEEKGDESHPNQIYVFLEVQKYISNEDMPEKAKPNPPHPVKRKRRNAYQKLMDFAIFFPMGSGFADAIKSLEKLVDGEQWYYGNQSRDSYPILTNYFLLTFERLMSEDEEHKNDPLWRTKIRVSDTNAVFNTGLVDHLYEPIYAVFKKNWRESDPHKWVFWKFVKCTDKEHQILTRVFGTDLPKPAHYYNKTSELVYDINSEIGSYNWNHIIDHCDRLPLTFLRDNAPAPNRFNFDDKHDKAFYDNLARAIKADQRWYNSIKNRILDAIDYALKRVRWNFKTAIPIYYPGQKQISLLLPLLLTAENKIDVALVLEATESGAYIAHTILTLDMAYTNARLITRPDSDWLMAKNISVQNESISAVNID